MHVLARLVVLRPADDQLLERDALRRDQMEVLVLLDGTRRDHGLSTPDDGPHDGRSADVGHSKTHRERVAVRRLVRRHEGLTWHPHDRDHHARCDRFTVPEQLQQPADPHCRDYHTARARSEEGPATDLEGLRAAAAVFLPKFRQELFRATIAVVHGYRPFSTHPERERGWNEPDRER